MWMWILYVSVNCANSALNSSHLFLTTAINISLVTSFSLQQLTVDDEHGNNGHGGDVSLS